jgi:mRNA interferase MazF
MRAHKRYVPNAGDIVWLRAGHKQASLKLAVVLSPEGYNERAGLMVCCPVATQAKGYPFEVSISGKKPSVVLADQVKSLDWQTRLAKFEGKVSPAALAEIRHKATLLLNAEKS